MIKRIILSILFLISSSSIFAGHLFNVSATGPSGQLSLTLCLNGNAALSCQNYTVSALTLNITTVAANHTYPAVGIKINTPGFTPTGCTLNNNGYCLFSVSDKKIASLPIISQSCQGLAGQIVFSPAVTYLNNPTSGSNPSQPFTITMTACNSLGQPLTPSVSNPFNINVYGAATGLITPSATTTSTGSVTLTYNGDSFPNNISINAWISDSSNNGAALGVTEVLKQNTPSSCSYGATSYQVPLVGTLPDALQVKADVGYDTSAPTTSLKTYTIDTGSLGVVVPLSDLPHNANVIGPGAAGVKYYDSSGNTFSGHYYLAPVRVQLVDTTTVKTQPIMVLAIDKAYCTGPTTKACYSNPPQPTLRYLGVGFNRNSSTTNDLFNSPTANAFLHITNVAHNGTDVTPGYIFTPNDSTALNEITLGMTTTTNYNLIHLTPNTSVPGDFNAQSGCFGFPDHAVPNQFCGTALLDVGIDYMFIDLPKAEWPSGTYDSNDLVPAGVNMGILMGSVGSPALSYGFTAVQSNPPADTATPAKVQWIDTTNSGQIFVNTGRRPLYIYNYLYNGQCGEVGFKPLS